MKPISCSIFSVAALIFSCFPLAAQSNITLAGSQYSFQPGIRVAPGQVLTLLLTGLKTVLPATASAQRATSLPLPTSLAGISVALTQTNAANRLLPLFALQQIDQCSSLAGNMPDPSCLVTALTIQIPFDVPLPNPLREAPFVPPLQIVVSENGTNSQAFNVFPAPQSIHIANTCDLVSGGSAATVCTPIVTHADNSLVSVSSPAVPGEILVMYALGLGVTSPAVAAGQASPAPAAALVNQIGIGFNYANPVSLMDSPPSGVAPPEPAILFAGLTPGLAGEYQINFRVGLPTTGAAPCSSGTGPNLTLTLQGAQGSSDQAAICVDTLSVATAVAIANSATKNSPNITVPPGVFIPNTIWLPLGSNLTNLGQPLPPGTGGVSTPSRPD